MGLLKAGVGAVGGVLADSWRDYFSCDALDANTLMAKGQKRTSSKGRSSNTKGESNIISNGSVIAVNEGQFMIIVEQGAIVEACGEPGEFVFDTSTEPSLFFGDEGFGDRLKASFKQVGARFTFGADTGQDQRVYFVNTKEIMGNRYGTAAPVPFRVVDANIGLDTDISVRCNGEYSYRIVDPLMFYKNVCSNVDDSYTRDQIDSQLKSELLTALQPAFAKISAMGVRYSAVPAHTQDLADALNEVMSEKWSKLRGIEVISFGVNAISASPEDEAMIKDLQKAAVMRDPNMRAANIAAAQSDAMRMAASNENGAMAGFMGMGLAGAMGGMALNQVGAAPAGGTIPANQYGVAADGGFGAGAPSRVGESADSWTCSCGAVNTGRFCGNCGGAKPVPADSWVCDCGAQNTGKFCVECGKPRPQAPGSGWICSCGQRNEGAFCSNCGNKRP